MITAPPREDSTGLSAAQHAVARPPVERAKAATAQRCGVGSILSLPGRRPATIAFRVHRTGSGNRRRGGTPGNKQPEGVATSGVWCTARELVLMSIRLVFETHSQSEDNELGFASGWLPGRLSARGRKLASELGARRANDGLAAVFTSDLRRAVETVEIAFGGSGIPVFIDWRLRECDYGSLNGGPTAEIHAERRQRLRSPYPGGESWEEATSRVGRFVADLPTRWSGDRVLVIGHVATRWALDHLLKGAKLEELVDADFAWRPGWEYVLDEAHLDDEQISAGLSGGPSAEAPISSP